MPLTRQPMMTASAPIAMEPQMPSPPTLKTYSAVTGLRPSPKASQSVATW